MARRRTGSRIRRPKRQGNWFAVSNSGYTNVAAGTVATVSLLSAFDEPITVVRIFGEMFIFPQVDATMAAAWMIWLDEGGLGGTAQSPVVSTDVQRESILMHKNVTVRSRAENNANTLFNTVIDVKVARKIPTEGILRLNVVADNAYQYRLNCRMYVKLA